MCIWDVPPFPSLDTGTGASLPELHPSPNRPADIWELSFYLCPLRWWQCRCARQGKIVPPSLRVSLPHYCRSHAFIPASSYSCVSAYCTKEVPKLDVFVNCHHQRRCQRGTKCWSKSLRAIVSKRSTAVSLHHAHTKPRMTPLTQQPRLLKKIVIEYNINQ